MTREEAAQALVRMRAGMDVDALVEATGTQKEKDEGVDGYTVICVNYETCPIYGADTKYYRTPQAAAKIWNRRIERLGE